MCVQNAVNSIISKSTEELFEELITGFGPGWPDRKIELVNEIAEDRLLEVRDSENQITRYATIDQIKRAISEGVISPEMEARFIVIPLRKSGEIKYSDIPVWKKVSKGLSKLREFRPLFEPIWAHSIWGAKFSALTGIVIWLALGTYNFMLLSVLSGIPGLAGGFMLATIVSVFYWAAHLFPNILLLKTRIMYSTLSIITFFIIMSVIWGHGERTGFVLWFISEFFLTFPVILGSIVGGAVFLGCPGMILGTLFGRLRLKKINASPFAKREGSAVYLKGVLLPAVVFIAFGLITLYLYNYYLTMIT